jgi:hypothetical protein
MTENNVFHNRVSFYKGLLLGLLLTGIISFLWCADAENRGKWAVEKDALLVGVARYGVDPITAKPVFEWKK